MECPKIKIQHFVGTAFIS